MPARLRRALAAVAVGMLAVGWTAPPAGAGQGGEGGPSAATGSPAATAGGVPEPGASLKPILLDAEARRGGPRARPTERPARTVEVDAAAHLLRIPVRPTRTRGVVERLLGVVLRPVEMEVSTTVLISEAPVRAVVRAAEKAGLRPGRPPQRVGAEAARPPQGTPVVVTLVGRGPADRTWRVPAEHLLAERANGPPLRAGRWIWTGPQTVGEEGVLMAEVTGSLATPVLRDTSAVLYWVPAGPGEGGLFYEKAFYARPGAVPEGPSEWWLEVRPGVSTPTPGKGPADAR